MIPTINPGSDLANVFGQAMSDPLPLAMHELRRVARQAGVTASQEAKAAGILPAGLLVEGRDADRVTEQQVVKVKKKAPKPDRVVGRRSPVRRTKAPVRRARA